MSSHSFKVKSIYEYTSSHDDDLYFGSGQIITVTQEEDHEWYSGEYINESGVKLQGIFPKNFVEIYEPAAPPRPNHNVKPKGTERPQEMKSSPDTNESELPPLVANRYLETNHIAPIARESSPAQSEPISIMVDSSPSAKFTKPYGSSPNRTTPSEKSVPPPIFEKPVSNSFKDRVAAFNKHSSIPSPFKPGGFTPGHSSTFVKKPFIAPPPSKNAYIPLPRDQSIPHACREEDHNEIRSLPDGKINAEKSSSSPDDTDSMDQLKPTSLKERIALLQKQQLEHSSRLADAALKKDKIKRSTKKQVDPTSQIETNNEGSITHSESAELKGSIGRVSMEENEQEVSKKSKSSSEAHSRLPCEEPGSEALGASNDSEEVDKIDHDDKYEASEINAPNRTPVDITQNYDLQNEKLSHQEDLKDDEDEDIDAEIKRKEDLRNRMAKIGGGIGMHGIFGPPGGIHIPGVVTSPRIKSRSTNDKKNVSKDVSTSISSKDSIPTVPFLGQAQIKPQDVDNDEGTNPELVNAAPRHSSEIGEDNSCHEQANSLKVLSNGDTSGGRSIPPIPLATQESRIPSTYLSTSPNTALELHREILHSELKQSSTSSPIEDFPQEIKETSDLPDPTRHTKKTSEADQVTPISSINSSENKRVSRLPPPIPDGILSHQTGPGFPQSRPSECFNKSTTHGKRLSTAVPIDSRDKKETQTNEFIQDTDFLSNTNHNGASNTYVRDASIERSNSFSSSVSPPPTSSRSMPSSSPCDDAYSSLNPSSSSRLSIIMPRSAPPPPPASSKILAPLEQNEDENDLQKFSEPRPRTPSVSIISPANDQIESKEEDLYSASPPRPPIIIPKNNPSQSQREPLPPPRESLPPPREPLPPPRESLPPPRESLTTPRESAELSWSANLNRRSIDLSRISMDSGYVANDIDLAPLSFWWTQPNGIPPVFHGRQDILFESDETSSSDEEKSTLTKRIYILFQDYSQTIVSAHFDTQNPADVKLEQRHEQPPTRPRQDQLERAYEQIGQCLIETVTACKESVVGDGKPHSLILELLKPLDKALRPVGNRSYGALVYGNIANASTQQSDEIRPGDVITFRNSKFQGKHGPLGAKYTMEVGKPHHVGVVAEWDGTKKKIRAWEQGRENKKVKIESFKLEDLRSGEVKVWRIMPRSWVGWEGQK